MKDELGCKLKWTNLTLSSVFQSQGIGGHWRWYYPTRIQVEQLLIIRRTSIFHINCTGHPWYCIPTTFQPGKYDWIVTFQSQIFPTGTKQGRIDTIKSQLGGQKRNIRLHMYMMNAGDEDWLFQGKRTRQRKTILALLPRHIHNFVDREICT